MRVPTFRIRALLLGLAAVAAGSAHANLLVNGSFEAGSFNPPGSATATLGVGSTAITGWSVVNDALAWIGTGNPWGLSANDGERFLDLTDYSAGAPFGGVTQTIATIPGASYVLSFDLGSSSTWGLPDAITASAAGSAATFTSASIGGTDDWNRVSMAFTATSDSTTVQLRGSAGRNYIGLDNASVDALAAAPIPEPGSWALMLAGLAALGTLVRRRRRADN